MKHTLLPAQMRDLERRFFEKTGFPSLLAMEQAAQAVTEALRALSPPRGRVLFLCGSGNNGGDGCAAARLWAQAGGRAEVWLTTPPAAMPEDARRNAEALSAWQIPTRLCNTAPKTLPEYTDAVVDALFGTGLSRPVRGLSADLIALVNGSGLPVVSVDVPSGVDGATGAAPGAAVQAHTTVTFHRPKPGHFLFPGRGLTGALRVAPVGIPPAWDDVPGYSLLEPSDLPGLMPRRSLDAHKGTSGHLLLVAGSLGMAGAACLSALGATHAGVGLLTVACPLDVVPIVQTLVPTAVAHPLASEGGQLSKEAAPQLEGLLAGKTCLALGPGLGRGPGVAAAIAPALQSPLPKVVDADALYALGTDPAPLPQAVLTPHPGEMSRLLGGKAVAEIAAHPVDTALDFAAGRHEVLLLKGATTVLCRDEEVALHITGHPAMAQGGSGDVLTGVIGALLAQGQDLWTAARLGALIHGMAGQWAARQAGTLGATAGDLADGVAQVLRAAEEGRPHA